MIPEEHVHNIKTDPHDHNMVMMMVGALCVCAKEVSSATCITLMNWEPAHIPNII